RSDAPLGQKRPNGACRRSGISRAEMDTTRGGRGPTNTEARTLDGTHGDKSTPRSVRSRAGVAFPNERAVVIAPLHAVELAVTGAAEGDDVAVLVTATARLRDEVHAR